MRQVFISYSAQEAAQADNLVNMLERMGVSCWIAPRDIPVGSDYTDEIPEGIEECPYFLILLSPRSQSSQWVKMELTQAVADRKTVFPLLLEDFNVKKGFKFLLQNAQIRPYFREKDATLRELVTRITGQQPPAAPNPPEPSGKECFQMGKAFFDSKQYDQAIPWFEQAFQKGITAAANSLGMCWYYKKNLDKSVAWYDTAISRGDPNALANKGLCYSHMDEAHRDWKKAEAIFLEAARSEHSGALYYLGEICENGRTGTVDLEKAMDYYERAAKRGDSRAPEALNRVRQRTSQKPDGDEMFPAAVDVILETGQASVSMLQRRLKLGYARAARLVDEMEDKGIVGHFQGARPRTILITKEQWEAQKASTDQVTDDPPF